MTRQIALSTAPATTASTRRGVAGSSAATATSTRSSSGSRANPPGLTWRGSFGATSAAQTSATARTESATAVPACRAAGGAACRRRHSHHGALPHRHGEPGQRGGQQRLGERVRQHAGRGDGQHDALRGRHDLAPAPRRQRRAHPRQQPLPGEEDVAGGPDREHPRAVGGRDGHAEGEDEERVDLAVEARPERAHRARAPRHPPVDRVERERGGGERDEQRGVARIDRERGDAGGEHRPRERHPRRGPERARGHPSPNRDESA